VLFRLQDSHSLHVSIIDGRESWVALKGMDIVTVRKIRQLFKKLLKDMDTWTRYYGPVLRVKEGTWFSNFIMSRVSLHLNAIKCGM